MPHARRDRPDIPLTAKYSAAAHPTYNNYPAIEVGFVKNIPADYYGQMGVPITFLLKHNPRQFDLAGKIRFPAPGWKRVPDFVPGTKTLGTRLIIRRAKAGANWIEREDLDRNSIYGGAGGFVYVAVIPGDRGWYKIGKAENVAKRVKGEAFARKDPKVVMSLEVHNRRQAEKQAHQALRQHRKKGKEWFKVSQKELESALSAMAGKPIRLWQ